MTGEHGVEALDALAARDPEALVSCLASCCGARRWAQEMTRRAPFGSEDRLFRAAEEVADLLETEDWLEAFRHHPRIGDVESPRARFGARAGGWSAGEQAGIEGTGEELIRRLAAANHRYEERFGHLFVVCATGKGAAEMLEILEGRLANDPETELAVASGEQRRITRLRLEKLLCDEAP